MTTTTNPDSPLPRPGREEGHTLGPWESDKAGTIVYGRSREGLKTANTEICAARSSADAAHILRAVNSYDALVARVAELEHYADECAHAIGVEYEAEGHATVRGPLEDVVRHIRDAVRDSGELIDVRNSLRVQEGMYLSVSAERDTLRTQNDALVEALERLLRDEKVLDDDDPCLTATRDAARAALALVRKP